MLTFNTSGTSLLPYPGHCFFPIVRLEVPILVGLRNPLDSLLASRFGSLLVPSFANAGALREAMYHVATEASAWQ